MEQSQIMAVATYATLTIIPIAIVLAVAVVEWKKTKRLKDRNRSELEKFEALIAKALAEQKNKQ